MKSALKWILLGLFVTVAVVGLWKREEITRLMAVQSLFSEEKIVSNFSNMDAAFLNVEVPRGDGPVSPLPEGIPATLPAEVANWVEDRSVTAIVVLKDGAIATENYYRGTGPEDRRISWSVAKSFLSALFGVAVAEGDIASIDDLVIKYAPSLKGSAYERTTIRSVLNMTSGVVFNEDYLDFYSDINRMGRVLALGGSMDRFAESQTDSFGKPGKVWRYVSIDTHVLSMVLKGATGRPIAELLSEKIIVPLGLEQSPYYLTDGYQTPFVLGGLNMRTRDYARFGQMYLQNGAWKNRQVVPSDWVKASTAPSAPTEPGQVKYGFQWWIPRGAVPGEFMAQGIYGQYIYINRPLGVVIAVNAADRKFREPGVSVENRDIFRLIANHLQG